MQFTFSKPSTWGFDRTLADQLTDVDWHSALKKDDLLEYAMAVGVFSATKLDNDGRSATDLLWNEGAMKRVASNVFGTLSRDAASSPHAIYALDAGMVNYLKGYSGGVAVCFEMISDLIARSSSPEQAAAFQQGFVMQARNSLRQGEDAK